MAKVKPVKVTRGERLAKQLKCFYDDYLMTAEDARNITKKLFPRLEWHTYQPLPTFVLEKKRGCELCETFKDGLRDEKGGYVYAAFCPRCGTRLED